MVRVGYTTLFSSRWISIPALVGQQDGPWDLNGLFFGRLESGKTALNFLARWHLVLLCGQGEPLVCFLLKCLCKSGCWVSSAASHMLWLGSLVGQAEGFPGGASSKEPNCQCGRCKRHRFDPSVRKTPWRRAWKPTPVFLPGESMNKGARQSIVHKVTKSQTWLKWLRMPAHRVGWGLYLTMGGATN